jgi:hemolysin activation/secretion protein
MRESPGSAVGVPDARRGRAALFGALLAMSAALAAGSALAQTQTPSPQTQTTQTPSPFPPGFVPPSQERPQPTVPTGTFDFSIETPRRSPVPRAVDELRFQLKEINIVGATVFSPDELRPLYGGLIGKEVSLSDILNVAEAIEGKYRERGFIISRAYVPPQRVGNGVFTINVVEGYVSAVALEGGDPGVRNLIQAYIGPVTQSRPLVLEPMERGLLLANDLPGITAAGLLRPSPDTPGASDLVVNVTQTPLTGGINTDNRGSKFTERWTVGGDVEWNSPLGDGDQVSANIQSAPDPEVRIQGTARYQHPIGTSGLTGSIYVTVSKGAPTASLGQFNITTDSLAAGPRLSYPLIRTRAQSLTLEGGITYQDAEVHSGTPAAQISHDHWRVFDAALTYTQSGFWNGNTSATFDVAQGIPGLGATENNSPSLSRPGAHTDFTKVTGTVKRVQVIWGPVNVALTAQGQYAFAPLVAGEQISFGGYQIGRGYDPSALSGDHGAGGSVELRYDARIDQYFIQTVEPYIFYDAAKIWNRLGGNGSGQALHSTGAGIRVGLEHGISAGVEYARTLSPVLGSDNGSLKSKVLFNAAVRF